MKVEKKKIIYALLLFLLALGISSICYSQFFKKETISAVLHYEINLEEENPRVFAITTLDQKLSSGKILAKGTRFSGRLTKEQNDFVLSFDTVEKTDGTSERISGKTIFTNVKSQEQSGVSARIGNTLYEKTRTSVIGAIFTSPSMTKGITGTVLPRGTNIKIELD